MAYRPSYRGAWHTRHRWRQPSPTLVPPFEGTHLAPTPGGEEQEPHGIGAVRIELRAQGVHLLAREEMPRVKAAFDPSGIFAPGRYVGGL